MSLSVIRLILTGSLEAAKLIIDALDGDEEAAKRVGDILPSRLRSELVREQARLRAAEKFGKPS
jgi:hypothetical protein